MSTLPATPAADHEPAANAAAEGFAPPPMGALKRMALFFAGPFITMAYAAQMPLALLKLWREDRQAAAGRSDA